MRWRISISTLSALAMLIPASSAVAQGEVPGMHRTTCEMVEYSDIRELVTIDLDTASDSEIRLLAVQILSAAVTDTLATLPSRIQTQLDSTPTNLRTFLKTNLQTVFTTDLRIATTRTLTNAGTHVQAAAQQTLDNGTIDALLTYLNHGLYVARALDACAPVVRMG